MFVRGSFYVQYMYMHIAETGEVYIVHSISQSLYIIEAKWSGDIEVVSIDITGKPGVKEWVVLYNAYMYMYVKALGLYAPKTPSI